MAMTETAGERADISNALSQYLNLFKADNNQFKAYMASNSVVDWFGRTIRGPTKIHDYLRNEVGSKYDHRNFEEMECCGPIEYKPTHMRTKTLPSDDVDYTLPINKVFGITSLKLYAESDIEDNNDIDKAESSSVSLPAQASPTELHLNSSAAITPPTSSTKADPSDTSETESENEEIPTGATAAKRRKLSHSPSRFSYLRRYQSNSVKRKLINDIGIRAVMAASNTDDEDDEEHGIGRRDDGDGGYTVLKYFVVTGTLRSVVKNCQQKFYENSQTGGAVVQCTNSGSNNNNEDVTGDTADVGGYWDRPVRLRISFRRRIKDKQIQFALIIYENPDKASALKMQPKRNLMLQFNGTEPDSDIDEGDDPEECGENEQADTIKTKLFSHESLLQEELLTANEKPMDNHPLMTTPTKFVHTPPATPTRKPRIPHALSLSSSSQPKRSKWQCSGEKVDTSGAAPTPSPKRSAARSLRL